MKNENDERYKKAHLQLFRSTDILINALLETEIISKDSEFYTFSLHIQDIGIEPFISSYIKIEIFMHIILTMKIKV